MGLTGRFVSFRYVEMRLGVLCVFAFLSPPLNPDGNGTFTIGDGAAAGGGGRRLGFFVEEDADGVGVVTSLGMTSSAADPPPPAPPACRPRGG